MRRHRVRGSRVQITGSGDKLGDQEALAYAHGLVRILSAKIVRLGGGLVITLGGETLHQRNKTLSTIFDWTVVEGFLEGLSVDQSKWPNEAGPSLVAVGFNDWQERIPLNRKELWSRALKTHRVKVVQLPNGLNIGGILRDVQSRFGDMLVVVGGAPGSHHSADLYLSEHKPIIPIDLQLGIPHGEKREAERLASIAIQSPTLFFHSIKEASATARFSLLSLKKDRPDLEDYGRRFLDFINDIKPPQAFLVRLQNRSNSRFEEVDSFFRKVIKPVSEDLGFQTYEVGMNLSKEPFLNTEIFKEIDSSTLVVCDLTRMRPNCVMELAYALGQGKKIVITARKGTILPFDIHALPCFFWSPEENFEMTRRRIKKFVKLNIDRGPLVREQSFSSYPIT